MTRPLAASLIGPQAVAALRRNGRGTVLSSHAAGLYVTMDDGALVALHEETHGLVPFGLGCPPPAHPEGWKIVPPGTIVSVDPATASLRLGGVVLDHSRATTPHAAPPWETAPPNRERLRTGLETCAARLAASARHGVASSFAARRETFFSFQEPVPPLDDVWEKALWRPLQALAAHCLTPRNDLSGDSAALVAALVGLGPGLTPLADDVLCGMLAAGFALRAAFPLSAPDLLVHDVAPAASRSTPGATTSQSAAFLLAAAAGERFGLIDLLTASIYRGTPAALDAAFNAANRVGHSSGNGLLLGAVCAAELAVRSP